MILATIGQTITQAQAEFESKYVRAQAAEEAARRRRGGAARRQPRRSLPCEAPRHPRRLDRQPAGRISG